MRKIRWDLSLVKFIYLSILIMLMSNHKKVKCQKCGGEKNDGSKLCIKCYKKRKLKKTIYK